MSACASQIEQDGGSDAVVYKSCGERFEGTEKVRGCFVHDPYRGRTPVNGPARDAGSAQERFKWHNTGSLSREFGFQGLPFPDFEEAARGRGLCQAVRFFEQRAGRRRVPGRCCFHQDGFEFKRQVHQGQAIWTRSSFRQQEADVPHQFGKADTGAGRVLPVEDFDCVTGSICYDRTCGKALNQADQAVVVWGQIDCGEVGFQVIEEAVYGSAEEVSGTEGFYAVQICCVWLTVNFDA